MQTLKIGLGKGGKLPSGFTCELNQISICGCKDKSITYYHNQFFNESCNQLQKKNGGVVYVFTEEQVRTITQRMNDKGITVTTTELDGCIKIERVK